MLQQKTFIKPLHVDVHEYREKIILDVQCRQNILIHVNFFLLICFHYATLFYFV